MNNRRYRSDEEKRVTAILGRYKSGYSIDAIARTYDVSRYYVNWAISSGLKIENFARKHREGH